MGKKVKATVPCCHGLACKLKVNKIAEGYNGNIFKGLLRFYFVFQQPVVYEIDLFGPAKHEPCHEMNLASHSI